MRQPAKKPKKTAKPRKFPAGCFEITEDNINGLVFCMNRRLERACQNSAAVMRGLGDPNGAEFFEYCANLHPVIMAFLPRWKRRDDDERGEPLEPRPNPPAPAMSR